MGRGRFGRDGTVAADQQKASSEESKSRHVGSIRKKSVLEMRSGEV